MMNFTDTYNPLYGRIINVRTESLKKKKKKIESKLQLKEQDKLYSDILEKDVMLNISQGCKAYFC